MRKEEIPTLFLNKFVKLVKKNDFVLYGYIREINDTGLHFETDQATSFISLDTIADIVMKKEENDG
jgi:hypothetical protein